MSVIRLLLHLPDGLVRNVSDVGLPRQGTEQWEKEYGLGWVTGVLMANFVDVICLTLAPTCSRFF